MKQCPECKQALGEAVRVCPMCGADAPASRVRIGRFALLEQVNETPEWCAFRGRAEGDERDRLLRVLTPGVAMDEGRSARLRSRIETLRGSPSPYLVAHEALERDADGTWFVVSEWVDCTAWGDVMGERLFLDPRRKRVWVDLFAEMAAALDALHRSGQIAPNLKLADFLPVRRPDGSYGVKLDCSLSPFLRSQAATALAPEHPDTKAGRALDARSDIHSLGTIFLDLATGTMDTPAAGYPALVEGILIRHEPIVLHRKLGALFKAMVSDDPDGRPSSAASIHAKLKAVTDHDIAKWVKFEKDPWKRKRLVRRIRRTAAAAMAFTLLATGGLLYLQQRDTSARIGEMAKRNDLRFSELHEKLKQSAGFVLVHLWEEVNGRRETVGVSSGTAFLVSEDGYLLSNRHVVCPWLDDEDIDAHFRKRAAAGVESVFGHTLYLWFEGETAFRTAAMGGGSIEDQYRTDTAYSSAPGASKPIRIAGVMPRPTRLGETRRALEDDVAVLKVSTVPAGAWPVPLATGDAARPRPATAVMAIGFPDGRAPIEGAEVVATRTTGTVTSAFADMFGIDASLRSGNSGGPVVDLNGHAVGIATAVFMASSTIMDSQGQHIRLRASASDAGRVLPIDRAAAFLEAVRSGQPAWKGLPEFAYRRQLEQAKAAAAKGDWAAAASMAADFPDAHGDPDLLFWTALLSAEPAAAVHRTRALDDAVAIHPAHFPAHFLRYFDDWRAGKDVSQRRSREVLLALDWRSEGEFFATLVHLIESARVLDNTGGTAETSDEFAIFNWIAAIVREMDDRLADPELTLLAAHRHVTPDCPFAYVILHAMDERGIARETRRERPVPALSAHAAKTQIFNELFEVLRGGTADPAPIQSGQSGTIHFERAAYAEDAFTAAGIGDWDTSLDRAERFLEGSSGRASARFLQISLLRAQILLHRGNPSAMNAISKSEGWHARTARILMNRDGASARKSLTDEAAKDAHILLTLEFALGLSHDLEGRTDTALQHYRNALDTMLVNRPEHAIAHRRIRILSDSASANRSAASGQSAFFPRSNVEPPTLSVRHSTGNEAPASLRVAANSLVAWWETKAGGVIQPEQDPSVRRTHDIYARVLRVADKRGKYFPLADSLRVVDTGGDPWAMALPSGHIVLSRQALDLCFGDVSKEEGDARMAFVLGHELGHLAADDFRHAQAYLSFAAAAEPGEFDGEILRTLREGGDAARLLGNEAPPEQRAKAAEIVRAAELHADDSGFLYAAAAGFRVDLLAGDGDDRLSFFEHWTRQVAHRVNDPQHPAPETRAAFLRARMRRLMDFVALFDAGVLSLALGDYDAALPLFEAYLKVFPSSEVFNNMGLCYLRRARPFGLSDLGELDHSTRARHLRPHQSVSLFDAIRQPDEATLRDLRFAAACFEQAGESDAFYIPARINLAIVSLVDAGVTSQRSLAGLEQILSMRPEHPFAKLAYWLLRARFEKDPGIQALALDRLAQTLNRPHPVNEPGMAVVEDIPVWLTRHASEILVHNGRGDAVPPHLKRLEDRPGASEASADVAVSPPFADLLHIDRPVTPGMAVSTTHTPPGLAGYRTVPFHAGLPTLPDRVYVSDGHALVVVIDNRVRSIRLVFRPPVDGIIEAEHAALSRVPLPNGDRLLMGGNSEALLTRDREILEYWQSSPPADQPRWRYPK